jgi:VWFA-related protein
VKGRAVHRFSIGAALAGAVATGVLAQADKPQQSAAGQQPSPVPGTFRSRITLVPLDIRVLAQSGRPIANLRQEDFTVIEDGEEQRIAHFSRQLLTPDAPSDAEPRMRQPSSEDVQPQHNRVFLLALGRGRLQYPARGVDAAIRFVRERLLPQDQVAVLAYNRATDFTSDHEAVAHVLERFRERHERLEADLKHQVSGLAAVYGGREIPEKMQSEIDELFESPDTPDFRRLPAGPVLDLEGMAMDVSREYETRNPVDRLSFDAFVGQNVQTFHDLGNVYAGIEYLRYIEGEKHLVFITENGLFVPRVENDERLADVASDARVVIDTIKTGGVYGEPPGNRWLSEAAWAHNFAAMSLQNVSRLSGGQSSLFRYADDAFRRIDDATRSWYSIAYYPANTSFDGKFRTIEVKVKRPGVTVLARHGYFAREQLVPFDRRQFLTYSRVLAAGAYGGELTDIPVNITSRRVADSDSGRVLVLDVRIDPSKVDFTDAGGLQTASLDVAVFCADKKRRTVCEQWDKLDLKLTPEALERAKQEGLSYGARVPLTGEPRDVKVIVYEYGADVLGSTSARIQ